MENENNMMNNPTIESAEPTIEELIEKADDITIDWRTKKVVLYIGGAVVVIALTAFLEKKFGLMKKVLNKVRGIFKKKEPEETKENLN